MFNSNKYFEIWFRDGSKVHPSNLFQEHEVENAAHRFGFDSQDLLKNGYVDFVEDDGQIIGGVHVVWI